MSGRNPSRVPALLLLVALILALAGTSFGYNPEPDGEKIEFRRDQSMEMRRAISVWPVFQGARREWLAAWLKKGLYRAEIDLDGDGTPELLLMGEFIALCGTSGCETIILQKQGGRWNQVGTIKAHRISFILLPETDSGWRRFFNGEETYLRVECGYTTQENIDDEASRGHGPCDAY